ncbi:MAG: protein kinase [Planctomycetota bacterium]
MDRQEIGGYRIRSELGTGGMATVWLADGGDGPVAVKILHRHLLEDGTFRERFRREAEVGTRIRHPNVVRTLDFGLAGDGGEDDYLVMEYVEGKTLRELLDGIGRAPESLCRHVAREITHALVAIHAGGIVHRDLKPENIFITKDEVVKVMDLGVAFLADQAIRLSLTGQFVGSIFYAAPEQIQGGGKDIDPRVDLYQLGVLLYEMASGRHPYRAADMRSALRRLLTEEPARLSEHATRISPFFEELVHTLLQKSRDRRFASATALLRVLRNEEASDWWRQREERVRARGERRRVHVARETALYGRDAEIERARRLSALAAEGAGQTLLVTGEAGIGKSRLIDEVESLLKESDPAPLVLAGEYRADEAGTSTGAFSTAFREAFGTGDLAESLAPLMPSTPRLVPAFAALLEGDPVPDGATPLTRESLPSAFIEITRSLAARRPVVLVIEDLHAAPEEGRALFAALAMALVDAPVLVLGSSRRDLPREWLGQLERHEHIHRMELERLPEEAVLSILEEALGSPRLAETLHRRIAGRSDGKPFYIFELLRSLREGQFIGQVGDGTWVTTRAIRSLTVPETVRDLVSGRLDGLEESDRELLGAAACVGFGFEPGLVGKVAGLGRIPLLKRLGRLEKERRLVRSVGRKYTFDDHQVQEAIYEELPDDRRAAWHVKIATVLAERTDPERVSGETAVGLCHHFLTGGEPAGAGPYLDRAVDHLADGHLNGAAIQLLDRALSAEGLLEGPARVAALLRKAHHLDLLGWPDEEAEALEAAMALADVAGDPVLKAMTRRRQGMHLRGVSRYEEARVSLTEAAAIARAAGDGEEAAAATAELGMVAWHEGAWEEAAELAGTAGRSAGLAELSRGRFASARRHFEESLRAAREANDPRSEARQEVHLAGVLAAEGRTTEAIARLEDALAIARRIGDRQGEGLGYLGLGMLQPRVGRPVPGRQLLEEARAAFRQVGFREGEAAATHGIGLLVEDRDRAREAEVLMTEALSLRREIGDRSGIAESLFSLGRLRARDGRTDEAATDLAEARDLSREIDRPKTLVLAVAWLARLGRGDAGAARSILEEHGDRLGVHARLEARMALFAATGDGVHRDLAREHLDLLFSHAPADSRDRMTKLVPLYREALDA